MTLNDRFAAWVARLDAMHAAMLRRWYDSRASRRRWRIEPYRSFGTPHELQVRGRVLRHVDHVPAQPAHSAWRNLVEFVRRMESDERPGARVNVQFRDARVAAVTDDEGHFDVTLPVGEPVRSGWHEVALELVSEDPAAQPPVQAAAQVLIPAESARFAVISDLDDTVVWSDVKRKLRMLAMLARSNALTRKPFDGVAAYYRALHAGASGYACNPIFYVSNSPWNLHAPLAEFLDVNGLPRGPLMLRDFGDHLLLGPRAQRSTKRAAIDRVLSTYPSLPVVLIGDSADEDPELYAGIVHDYPGRVLAIQIRSVDPDPSRHRAIRELTATTLAGGVHLLLAHDSAEAADYAANAGLIDPRALAEIRRDVRREQSATDAR